MSQVRLAAEPRTEFGKGAARRTRRAGKIPAVLYGHDSDPKHLSLPALEFARVVREQGFNAVLSLDIANGGSELALTKTVTTHPLKNYIEHVDLLLVKRGEKVTVDVPVTVAGEPGPGTLVDQELTEIQVEADALNIPESFEVSVAGAREGFQVTAADVPLPSGVTLVSEPTTLLVKVEASPTAAQMDTGEETAPAEGESEES
ncbi:50S ribosomal protein L25 [Actinoalloteichus sp. AHMU CJ021]|uniref:Large ribosomal subunit protein bL25 n=1 Tax=Actinoalloteichus caeruleus DSM 43889 TaxID=1120930 RepID=A0ABT1JIW5_ACTCY|nr:50S ribosomal protein L25/general stress protein Ctc [Actinoalloteichus caeruleus]AUS78341.1 50S ribosomal protein L25 [Actinoalloteichus sp. AHMU CJ021]MCP2332418.1 large subunit ribosomal protein L25 [Actinoalloteichus caeruleus DSM 43889]